MDGLKMNQPGPSAASEFISDGHFLHVAMSNIGKIVRVQTLSGSIYEGVFSTFVPNFEVVLQMAHMVQDENDDSIAVESLSDMMVLEHSDVVSIEVKNVDLNDALLNPFLIDRAISKCSISAEEKVLEPCSWIDADGKCDCILSDNHSKGWDANDMFKINETLFGVRSSFDPLLSQYTIPLRKNDTKDYKNAEAHAEKIAFAILTGKNEIKTENDDEEESGSSEH